MKKLMITSLLGITMTLMNCLSAESFRVGYRDANMQAVLDADVHALQSVISAQMGIYGFSNIQIGYLDIADNVLQASYFKSMGIKIIYDDGLQKGLSLTFLYPIHYDPVMNVYTLLDHNSMDIQDGGKPDKNYCQSLNCIGCESLRNEDGKLTGCGDCTPSNPDKDFSCTVGNTAGSGGARVLTALNGILEGLVNML